MSDLTLVTVSANDVIQIAPSEVIKEPFHGMLAFVDEVANWGVKAHVATFQGDAHVRLPWGSFEVIGPAAYVMLDLADEEAKGG